MPEAIVSRKAFFITYIALVVLTLTTVSVSFLRLSPWHLAVALAFATVKASLVALYFMQLARSPARTWLAAGLGLFWLGILIVLTLSDYLTRHQATY